MTSRKIIRKIILEEILSDIKRNQALNEGALLVGAAALAIGGAGIAAVSSFIDDPMGAKVDRVTTHTPTNNVYLVMKKMIDSVGNAKIINRNDAIRLARELEAATLEYTVALVPATDEDAIKDIIERSGSKINFAIVCVEFEKITGKSFKDVYKDELSGGGEIMGTGYLRDQRTYVINPIMDLPFIILDVEGEETPLTEEEFLEQLELANKKAETQTSASSAVCTPPVEFVSPYFKNSVILMNQYAEEKGIEGWVDGPVQNKWAGESHQRCWELFVAHVFENCDLYKGYNLPDGGKTWKEVHNALKSKFPGYTYNTQGFLAFCLDAYCCEDTYGKQTRYGSGGTGGGRRASSGSIAASDGSRSAERRTKSSGNSNNVIITLNQTGENFSNSGFTSASGNIDERLISSLLDFRTQLVQRNGMPKTSVTVYFEVSPDGGKITGADMKRLDGHGQIFKLTPRQIESGLFDIVKNVQFPVNGSYTGEEFDSGKTRRQARRGGKFIRATFTFPAGRY